MQTNVLLLLIWFLPALAGILVTRPLWSVRRLSNETIQGIGLIVLTGILIGCLIPVFLGDGSGTGFACILLSLFNPVIFHCYERRLNTSRCPRCHTRNLRVHRQVKRIDKLYCSHCGLHSQWRRWR